MADRMIKGPCIPSHLLSPTPIRPMSPHPGSNQSSPRRLFPSSRSSSIDRPRFLGEDERNSSGEHLDELSMEIFDIFTGSPRCSASSSVSSSSSMEQDMKPPSRNSNPLVRDRVFSTSRDADSLATSLDQAVSIRDMGSFSPLAACGTS